ncbi:hypothetical protein WJX77_011979 [Trebouxia sp. C0004]
MFRCHIRSYCKAAGHLEQSEPCAKPGAEHVHPGCQVQPSGPFERSTVQLYGVCIAAPCGAAETGSEQRVQSEQV